MLAWPTQQPSERANRIIDGREGAQPKGGSWNWRVRLCVRLVSVAPACPGPWVWWCHCRVGNTSVALALPADTPAELLPLPVSSIPCPSHPCSWVGVREAALDPVGLGRAHGLPAVCCSAGLGQEGSSGYWRGALAPGLQGGVSGIPG